MFIGQFRRHDDRDSYAQVAFASAIEVRDATTTRDKLTTMLCSSRNNKVEFTIDAIDYKHVALLKQYVTDNGRVLHRKYTGLPAPFQRKLSLAIKRARQMLLMK